MKPVGQTGAELRSLLRVGTEAQVPGLNRNLCKQHSHQVFKPVHLENEKHREMPGLGADRGRQPSPALSGAVRLLRGPVSLLGLKEGAGAEKAGI